MRAWHGILALALATAACVRVPPRAPGGPVGEGAISFYGEGFEGHRTASGERFDPGALTAAHRSLPFGTCLEVENLENGRRVRVRVNDRGPYQGGRILDVSRAAALRLGMVQAGVARARLWRCGKAR